MSVRIVFIDANSATLLDIVSPVSLSNVQKRLDAVKARSHFFYVTDSDGRVIGVNLDLVRNIALTETL
jgi:hypothetical protein